MTDFWNTVCSYLPVTERWLTAFANAVTVGLGGFAIYELIVNRAVISEAVRGLSGLYLSSQMAELRDVIAKLEHIPCDDPTKQPEIKALIAKLTAQLSVLASTHSEFGDSLALLQKLLGQKSDVKEDRKCYATSHLKATIAQVAYRKEVINGKSQGGKKVSK